MNNLDKKLISVICPVYNEEKNIMNILKFFITSLYPYKELIIIDGLSTDKTREIVKEYCLKYNNIYLYKNPNKTVPYALNIGINESHGDIIIRIDAHCDYSENYFEEIVKTFAESGADVVGGPTRIAEGSSFQNAVGEAITSSLGTGNSRVHDSNYRGYTDHVTFGAWKKDIFNETGLFDERLTRNQDDEFHYRAKSMGKKIYLNPDIKLWYYPRRTILGLFKQYFQYGFFKPLVLFKIKSEIKLRHLMPSFFIIYIILIMLFYTKEIIWVPITLYFILILYKSILSRLKFISKIFLFFIFPTIHISYGLGFLLGIFSRILSPFYR